MKLTYSDLLRELNQRVQFLHTNWFVITGPPSSGKTTLINELSNIGFRTNPDLSRIYLENRISKTITAKNLRSDEKQLQRDIFVYMMNNILNLNTKDVIFHDYSLPDNIPFLQLAKIDIPNEIIKSSKLFRFKKVFICEPLKLEKDGIRTETEKEIKVLYQLIYDCYKSLGYELVKLPVIGIKDRLDIIKQHIKY
ncbi:MAG: ATP-binding protein [Bacteroidota bacterium]|nr:ATP-binding protein [Bacteroidota bacterium]